jgi:hypothetical protein
MQELICPFSATLTRDKFGCTRAEPVIRRGGTEFCCRDPAAHAECGALFERLKHAALSAFAVEDDLTQMPHSVLVKIQFGGLLGLQRITLDKPPDAQRVVDIQALVAGALARFGSVRAIPCEQLTPDMTGYSLTRRSRRQS